VAPMWCRTRRKRRIGQSYRQSHSDGALRFRPLDYADGSVASARCGSAARVRVRSPSFHGEPFHFLLLRWLPCPSVTTVHGRLRAADHVPLFNAFLDAPLVSISDSQRKGAPQANWIATVHHGRRHALLAPGRRLPTARRTANARERRRPRCRHRAARRSAAQDRGGCPSPASMPGSGRKHVANRICAGRGARADRARRERFPRPRCRRSRVPSVKSARSTARLAAASSNGASALTRKYLAVYRDLLAGRLRVSTPDAG
jgi:hypothetical protein